MRINKETTLGAFANTTGTKVHKKYRKGFVPLPKDPDAVLAPAMNLWERPVYVPSNDYVRPGADDHQRIKSRGL
jgi:hypothetical protein